MEDCFYCTKDSRLQELMAPVCGLAYTDVYLFRDQKHRGRCVVALHEHKTELFQLTAEQREGFFREAALVSRAVGAAGGAHKVNYAVYGDLVSHFHMHIVPKIQDGLHWGGPFSDADPGERRYLPQEEFEALREALARSIQNLAKEAAI